MLAQCAGVFLWLNGVQAVQVALQLENCSASFRPVSLLQEVVFCSHTSFAAFIQGSIAAPSSFPPAEDLSCASRWRHKAGWQPLVHTSLTFLMRIHSSNPFTLSGVCWVVMKASGRGGWLLHSPCAPLPGAASQAAPV